MEPTTPAPPSPIAANPSERPPSEVTGPVGPTFAEVFRTLATRIDEGERLTARVEQTRGALDATQLLVLQAGVYRYSEAVELASKLVDRLGSAVKTTLQSQ